MLAALLLVSCSDSSPPPAITIDSAWARATPGQSSTAAYFKVTNAGGGDRLLSVSTAVGEASLHSTSMDGGVMRMRQLDGLDIPADSTIVLGPGAIHVMVTGLRQPLEGGQQLPLKLVFERSGERVVAAKVGAGEPK